MLTFDSKQSLLQLQTCLVMSFVSRRFGPKKILTTWLPIYGQNGTMSTTPTNKKTSLLRHHAMTMISINSKKSASVLERNVLTQKLETHALDHNAQI